MGTLFSIALQAVTGEMYLRHLALVGGGIYPHSQRCNTATVIKNAGKAGGAERPPVRGMDGRMADPIGRTEGVPDALPGAAEHDMDLPG